jgi:hypothetical protein
LTIRSAYNILYFSNTILNKYRTISPAGTVGAELIFKFGGFSLGLDAGYLVDLTGELKHTKDNGYLLDPNDQDRALTTDWTGWQLHLAIHIPLNI